jgi:hypothetical protein
VTAEPITLRVEPSARLEAQARDERYTTTPEDLPTGEWTFWAIPRAGDDVENPESGENWTVERVVWFTDGSKPWLILR